MPSVRIGFDGGSVINVAGVIYAKATGQPSSGAVTTVPTDYGIEANEYEYDDSKVRYGSNHRTWTACEQGISRYGAGNQSQTEVIAATKTDIFTTPSSGTLRLYSSWSTGGYLYVYVNGAQVFYDESSIPGYGYLQSAAFILGSGSVVAVKVAHAATIYAWFLPNVYP